MRSSSWLMVRQRTGRLLAAEGPPAPPEAGGRWAAPDRRTLEDDTAMDLEPLWRMLLAAGLTVPIGLERELRGKAAGLRTHVVVGTAAAAFAYVSLLAAPEGAAGTDQTRIAAQVVSGIGFMGAGVIFASGGRVHGLTTAAALWGAAATGVCVGLGVPSLALALTVVLVAFLWPVDWLGDRVLSGLKREERGLQLLLADVGVLDGVQGALRRADVDIGEMVLRPFGGQVAVRLVVRGRRAAREALLDELRATAGVGFVGDEGRTDDDG